MFPHRRVLFALRSICLQTALAFPSIQRKRPVQVTQWHHHHPWVKPPVLFRHFSASFTAVHHRQKCFIWKKTIEQEAEKDTFTIKTHSKKSDFCLITFGIGICFYHRPVTSPQSIKPALPEEGSRHHSAHQEISDFKVLWKWNDSKK